MGKRRKKKGRINEDRHHIIPKSRKVVKLKKNIVFVDKQKHRDYHRLFHNKTPVEIMDYLVNYFWGGRYEFLDEVKRR